MDQKKHTIKATQELPKVKRWKGPRQLPDLNPGELLVYLMKAGRFTIKQLLNTEVNISRGEPQHDGFQISGFCFSNGGTYGILTYSLIQLHIELAVKAESIVALKQSVLLPHVLF